MEVPSGVCSERPTSLPRLPAIGGLVVWDAIARRTNLTMRSAAQ